MSFYFLLVLLQTNSTSFTLKSKVLESMNQMKYILLLFVIFSLSGKDPDAVQYFYAPTFEARHPETSFELVNFNDTIPNDTLFIIKNRDGLIHSYHRNILTGVCIDGECRMLDITLHWSVTGRYQGFQLPKGEFLSKSEHEPFQKKDYERLHILLADPYSELANYKMEELVPVIDENEVDGVTAATISGVEDYIVEDAVYSTYTIWHIVYGNTQDVIENYTRKNIHPDLLLKILNSGHHRDVVWGLENLKEELDWTTSLQAKLFELIANKDHTISGKAIESIPPVMLADEQNQLKLFYYFEGSSTFTQRKILSKLEEAPFLASTIEFRLAEKLPELNGSMIKNVLDLFAVHQIKQAESEEVIAALLDHENQFIARKAFQFLEKHLTDNKKIERQLKKYENRF